SRKPATFECPCSAQLTEANSFQWQLVEEGIASNLPHVCIVQQRSTKKYFALKYMSKRRCIDKGVAGNVLRELSLLRRISHPFIVNLWYTFQVTICNCTVFPSDV
ncbi:unnamed protein product, partial [Heligmosomoides polygyrus]|uniref:Protein kinase domain-containing protein n=1 Tax=Heligmosomoides polygyrus TaxID=6339 RepID=A0A183GQ81_HELPZ